MPHLTSFCFLPSGECYLLPSCPWHTGYCGLRRALQLLGQRCPHQVEDLRAARPAHHGLLLQPQRQHLCICFQLRLVEGRSSHLHFTRMAENCWHAPRAGFLTVCNFVLSYLFLRATSTTTPRKRTTSSWGTLPRSWSLGTRNGERRTATVCNRGDCSHRMGLPHFLSDIVTLSRAFKGTPWSLACMDMGSNASSDLVLPRTATSSHLVWGWYCTDLSEVLLKACVVSAVIVSKSCLYNQEFCDEACWLFFKEFWKSGALENVEHRHQAIYNESTNVCKDWFLSAEECCTVLCERGHSEQK